MKSHWILDMGASLGGTCLVVVSGRRGVKRLSMQGNYTPVWIGTSNSLTINGLHAKGTSPGVLHGESSKRLAPPRNITPKNKSDITPNPSGHGPQRPCAQGRTCTEQEYAQGAAPGQIKNQTVGRATKNGRTTKQEGEGWPTSTQMEAASGEGKVTACQTAVARKRTYRLRWRGNGTRL